MMPGRSPWLKLQLLSRRDSVGLQEASSSVPSRQASKIRLIRSRSHSSIPGARKHLEVLFNLRECAWTSGMPPRPWKGVDDDDCNGMVS
ncbi:hypothetical protein ACH5RR_025775 [Cinchona calisaya]|uniref:Uncharacterized protein n=1 Tax=Cinchona calisaya TaxID=153742 RepID=A0ABD2Z0L6_9GENT